MVEKFKDWLDDILNNNDLTDIVAFNFNLYEEFSEDDENENESFAIQLIGAPEYDPENPDWACNEKFTSGENLFMLTCADWEECLLIVKSWITEYINSGNYSEKLKQGIAVTVGFVDGDLDVIWQAVKQ